MLMFGILLLDNVTKADRQVKEINKSTRHCSIFPHFYTGVHIEGDKYKRRGDGLDVTNNAHY
ncbi:hypothetical protein GBAR_LOCUS17897 [Geodia barretti]|uniref:Uncharacterized protein n=1 Tax=Geodia barretti TaxID=519541 RepID=A0AA35WSU3_GEOBA|nr:hypothetical protein GBAR_LOCUS17897 [Geodia barretti]